MNDFEFLEAADLAEEIDEATTDCFRTKGVGVRPLHVAPVEEFRTLCREEYYSRIRAVNFRNLTQ